LGASIALTPAELQEPTDLLGDPRSTNVRGTWAELIHPLLRTSFPSVML
jgi:hypothetical protein